MYMLRYSSAGALIEESVFIISSKGEEISTPATVKTAASVAIEISDVYTAVFVFS